MGNQTDTNDYYVYRHIRHDKGEPFYIGIGKQQSKRTFKSVYSRAFIKTKRNPYWKNIVKNSQYDVEIIFDNISEREALDKEMEFIKLYGRKDLNLGTLSNMTNGGQGHPGVRGKYSKKAKFVYQYSKDGNLVAKYDTMTDAAALSGFARPTIRKHCQGKAKSLPHNITWSFDILTKEQVQERQKYQASSGKARKILQYDLNLNFIQEFNSIKNAALETNSSKALILQCCQQKREQTNNYIWKYKKHVQ